MVCQSISDDRRSTEYIRIILHVYNNIIYCLKVSSLIDSYPVLGKAARGKWKNLKDHFRKEYKRCVSSVNSDQEMSRWPYFYSMMFIREQISHTVTNGSMFLSDFQYPTVCPKTETTEAEGEEAKEKWVSAGPNDENSPNHEDDDDNDGYRPLNCLHVEYGNWSDAQDENFSDDKHFLLSLLPMFSTLAPDKKLKARIAIETSLLNIAYPDLTVQGSGCVGGGGDNKDDDRRSPRRVVELIDISQKSTIPRTKTTTSNNNHTSNTTTTTATITTTPDNNATSDTAAITPTATAVVTATATCTAVKTGSKKRKSEDDRLQMQKKVCTTNAS